MTAFILYLPKGEFPAELLNTSRTIKIRMNEPEIEVRCTIELLAKPKEAAVMALKQIVNNLEENGKKLAVSDITYSEPKLVEEEFYSAFSTFKIKSDITSIFGFILDYAPSSTELLSTKNLSVSPADLQGIFNDIAGRLNEMDQRIKMFSGQNVLWTHENEELKKKLPKR